MQNPSIARTKKQAIGKGHFSPLLTSMSQVQATQPVSQSLPSSPLLSAADTTLVEAFRSLRLNQPVSSNGNGSPKAFGSMSGGLGSSADFLSSTNTTDNLSAAPNNSATTSEWNTSFDFGSKQENTPNLTSIIGAALDTDSSKIDFLHFTTLPATTDSSWTS
jgi:hypothetical protein